MRAPTVTKASGRRDATLGAMKTFFTSDTHYGHKNIIKFDVGPPGQKHKRPYADIDEMKNALIYNWNSVVQPDDLVYHLGDFAFSDAKEATTIAKRLNGRKHLIWGNHDKTLRKSKEFMSQWIWCEELAEIWAGDQKIVLCHYPLLVWNKSHYGSWNVHGHCHGSLPVDKTSLRIDAGVDVWNYFPVSYEEIKKVMDKREFKPIDHHGARGNGH